jgi:uncharacterized protein YjgD (DUF1641 family)
MAKPIAIVPIPADNQTGAKDELLRKLDAAPLEHAAALLALWDLLEAAHEKQLLELAHGAISGGDAIIAKLAHAAASPAAIQGTRNLIMLAEMLGSLDSDVLHQVVKALPHALQQAHAQAAAPTPPSLWATLRQLTSSDARRALIMLAGMAAALGAAMGPKKDRTP